MRTHTSPSGWRLLAVIVAMGSLFSHESRADIAIVIEEFDDRIVVRYEGSLDTTSFTSNADSWVSEIDPANSKLYFSPIAPPAIGAFQTVTGDPVSGNAAPFGTGTNISNGVHAGDFFVITNSILSYPGTYVSGSPLAGSLTYTGATLETLGINRNLPQGYEWALTSGERVTLEVLTGLKKLAAAEQQKAILKAALQSQMKAIKKQLAQAMKAGKSAKLNKLKKSLAKLSSQIDAL
jgi:hypothetical protein